MQRTTTRRFWRATVAGIAMATALALGVSGCSGSGSASSSETLRIASIGNASFTRNFNPLAPTSLGMTTHAVYESMMVSNLAKGDIKPWLASSYKLSPDARTLTFTLKDHLTWSDGKPLTASDVAYTFGLVKKVLGDATYDYVQSVTATDAHTVVFDLNRAFSPAADELGVQVIVPEHIWKNVKNPATYTNPDPVGSGPFTQVANFTAQSYDLLRNPHYWQKDKAKYSGIRLIAYGGNDAANTAAINGDIDFGLGYIQDIQKTYVDPDKEHRGYWFPAVGSTISLTLNTTQAPFKDSAFRKAISMAINRKQVAAQGMSGYTHAADCTGLSDAYNSWRDESVASSCDWTKYDPAKANAALDAAGYTKNSDGKRVDENGKPIEFTIGVGSASTDWISVAQIISNNLEKVGVTAKLKVQDWSQINQALFGGTFQGNIAWSQMGVTPYNFYRGMMSCSTVKPVGEQASQNFQRYCNKDADALLDQFAAATSEAEQHAIMDKVQALYAQEAPTIPLFPGPEWGAYNSTNFVGWPSKANPYATLSPLESSTVVVLTTIHPRSK